MAAAMAAMRHGMTAFQTLAKCDNGFKRRRTICVRGRGKLPL